MTNTPIAILHRPQIHPIAFAILLAVLYTLVLPLQIAHAHQPFFEDEDTTQTNSIHIEDPTISTALYATIDSFTDIDYFIFNGTEGSDILLSITIPKIDGQLEFAPTVAIIGPGLPLAILPAIITTDSQTPPGSIIFSPTEPQSFFEPFSQSSYWRRQTNYITLPETSQYTVAVWSESVVRTGKYVLVIGDREIRGGDPNFTSKLKNYWTPMESQPQIKDLPVWQRLISWFRKMVNN
jgi:hypothetical protein